MTLKTFFVPHDLAADARARAQAVGGVEFWAPDAAGVGAIASRLRSAATGHGFAPERSAAALAAACARWRESDFERRRRTLSAIAVHSGFSLEMLSQSLDALLAPFSPHQLESLARALAHRPHLIGFVMPGNVVGAGMHELAQALVAGASVLLKSASDEPLFFAQFARTLAETDPLVGARLSVICFGRAEGATVRALQSNCDYLVAFGDDRTLDALGRDAVVLGFGSRVSGAILSREAVAPEFAGRLAAALARDVTLFEQHGCLSPHHVLVEDPAGDAAHSFAAALALALEQLAREMPPPAIVAPQVAAALRAVRETARWRKLGGEALDLWEGNRLSWSVIFDPGADFQLSPLYRTVYVTPVRDLDALSVRLAPVRGRLEAFALGDPANRLETAGAWLREAGVSYLAAPGMMQSPPLQWPHGRGVFLKKMAARS